MRRRHLAIAAVVATTLAAPAAVLAHELDHPVPSFSEPAPLSTNFRSGGEGAEWDLLATLPTANPHSDLDFFKRDGETYASVGVLGVGANGGGQTIVQLTQDGEPTESPSVVGNHPSAACVTNAAGTSLQHDVEATPKGDVILNTNVDKAERSDAQLILDATDAAGRCHDSGTLGVQNAPSGGLEIIDVTDVRNPVEIGLTTHIGESHTVNVDPRRPHIAYSVTSDSVGLSSRGVRSNESGAGRALDGFEIVNLRSCLTAPLGTIPAGATVEEKRALCRPEVYRFRWPSIDISLGHTNQNTVYGCHELEVYPDDTLTCGSGAAGIVFDMAKVFDDNGTPDLFTDDKVNGAPLPCRVRGSSNTGASAAFTTGAKVTDCVVGGTDEAPIDLGVPNWLAIGAPSIAGIQYLGSVFHQGREPNAQSAAQPDYDSTQDIDFNHEMELTDSRRFLLATDERGGGVTIGAQCTPGRDLLFANGGIHAYDVRKLQGRTPQGPIAGARADEAHQAYARNSKNEKAIYRAPVDSLEPEASFCTAHVFQQIPGQNRIFMGWYSQGTQVVDFTENADGTVDFKQAGFFVPENANQWVSAIFKMQKNDDGSFTYWGATGDGVVGDAGRNGIDVYKVTLPAPPQPASRVAKPEPKPFPTTQNQTQTQNPGPGIQPLPQPQPQPKPQDAACRSRAGFASANARGAGGAKVRFTFKRRFDAPVTVDVFRQSSGRKVIGERLVRRFTGRRSAFTWDGRDRKGRKLGDGYYFARFRIKGTDGSTDTVRITLGRSKGKFGPRRSFYRRDSCGVLRTFKLSRPVFGGRDKRALGIAYRVNRAARVVVTVTDRREKVVKRFKARDVAPGRTNRLKLPARGLGRGDFRVKLSATEGGRTATAVLTSRKL